MNRYYYIELCKYPPAKPEALWVAGPSKGPYRDPKSKSRASGSMLVADILEARSILLELSNFYCLPGRAGGSPVRTRNLGQRSNPRRTGSFHLPQKRRTYALEDAHRLGHPPSR